jgi:putative tricarboxylic transport membrane protein
MTRPGTFAILVTCCLIAGSLLASQPSLAFQPTRPVEMVIHSGPGSGADLFVRAMDAILEKEKLLTQRLRINSKTGGGGAVAMAYLAEKKSEAHTIALFTTVWVVVPLTSAEAKVTLMDLTPIARMVVEPAVVAVKANSPYRNMQDFIAAAKKSPGQLKQSGGSFTSVDNLTRLLVQKATGANWAFISFPSGAERLSSLLGEHVQIMFLQPQEAGEHIRAGNLRIIATLTEKRLASFPDIPTVGEQGISIPIPQQARGVVGPPGMPPDARAYWEDLFSRLTKTAKFFESSTAQMRGLLVEAGAKVAR